jgi:trk system potassium uptake protein
VKIIIAGDGKVGLTLTQKLSAAGHDLTLIDSNQRVLDSSVERYDVMGVQGNCASMRVLESADVKKADLLIAATSSDEVNLLCGMTAHGLNPRIHTIARIRNPEYGKQIFTMRDVYSLSLMVNPEKQAAREIERLIRYPGFLQRETFAKSRVEIVELRIQKGSKLCDVALMNLENVVKCKVLVCAVSRGGVVEIPSGHFILREGDHLFITATAEMLTQLLRNLGIITHKAKRVIICGGGRIGYYLSTWLAKEGVSVLLIEQDEARCEELSGKLPPEVCIIHGDASSQFLLESEGIHDCDAVVTMTGMDEMNMIISLYAQTCGVPQVITKVGHMENNSMQDSLGLGSVICPKELCCNTVIPDSESTCAGRSKSGTYGIKNRHFSQQEKQEIDECQHHVYDVQNSCCCTHFRHQLVHIRSRTLRTQQMHGIPFASLSVRRKCQKKYKYPHATQPVAETPPVHNSGRKCFHISQNRRTCGCKSRYNFKQGIDKVWNFPGKNKWQTPEKTDCYPASGYADHPFPRKKTTGGISAKIIH